MLSYPVRTHNTQNGRQTGVAEVLRAHLVAQGPFRTVETVQSEKSTNNAMIANAALGVIGADRTLCTHWAFTGPICDAKEVLWVGEGQRTSLPE